MQTTILWIDGRTIDKAGYTKKEFAKIVRTAIEQAWKTRELVIVTQTPQVQDDDDPEIIGQPIPIPIKHNPTPPILMTEQLPPFTGHLPLDPDERN